VVVIRRRARLKVGTERTTLRIGDHAELLASAVVRSVKPERRHLRARMIERRRSS
jgi:hypothetical protein